MVNFPGSLDALVTLTSSTKMNDAGYEGDTLVNNLNRIAEALEAKVGTGASTPTVGTVLIGTGTGTSAYSTTLTFGGNPATTGAIRLGNNIGIYSRDAGNAANAPLVVLNGSNTLTIGAGTVVGIIELLSSTSILPYSDAVVHLGSGSRRLYQVWTSNAVSIGKTTTPTYQLELATDSTGKPATSTWNIVSDEKVKDVKSFRDFDHGLAALAALPSPRRYQYNGRGNTPEGLDGVGWTAQEVQAVLPDMVNSQTVYTRPDPKKDEVGEDLLHVNYHNLFFVLTNAVRELAARLETLEGARA